MLFGKSFNPETDIPDLGGKTFLVTGGNTGIGLETVLQLAKHSPTAIYLATRTASKATAAIAQIKSAVPSATVHFLPLDLTSFASISSAAAQFNSRSPRLDVLVNNAGIMAVPASQTEDGFEIQFGTNHVGHALLTKLLLPTLLKTSALPGADVRVVTVASEAYNLSPKNLELDQGKATAMGPWPRYGQSKMANILFAKELAKRHPEITSVSLHPGLIRSDLWNVNRKHSPIVGTAIGLVSGLVFEGTKAGARNSLWAATVEKKKVVNGGYYKPVGSLSKVGSDEEAKTLWDWTEKKVEEKGF